MGNSRRIIITFWANEFTLKHRVEIKTGRN